MAQLGMFPLLLVQLLALLLLLAAVFQARQLKGSGLAPAARLPLLVGLATVFVFLGTLLTGLAALQEKTGRNLGVSGGIGSDARAWLKQHEASPPNRLDPGPNIRILSDAVAFLKAHETSLPADGKAKLQELARMPEKPKKLLTVSEQGEYYQAAQSGYDYIKSLAGTSPAAH